MSAKNQSNEIKLIRVYDAPVKSVWEAWTDATRAANWWGPRGFRITTHNKDLRPGGHWKYTMHGPDGVDYPNTTAYFEVKNEAKLVYDHGGSDDRPPLFRVTALFSEKNGKTTMDMTMAFPTPQVATEMRGFIKKAGGDATWDRLAEYLAKQIFDKEIFVINRSFDAPLDLMFAMWTNPNHVSKWMPPTGMSMEYNRADLRSGGSAFYCMSGPNGMKMYGRAEYERVEKPDTLVYRQQFCDENEKLSRHPMAPTWPETMLTHVKLSPEGPEQTRVTITWEPCGNTTRDEMATFTGARAGMTQGWTGSLDKLEEYLVEQRR